MTPMADCVKFCPVLSVPVDETRDGSKSKPTRALHFSVVHNITAFGHLVSLKCILVFEE